MKTATRIRAHTNTHAESLPWPDLSPKTLARTVWRGRLWLLRILICFAGLGIIITLVTPSEFVSEAKIMPEISSGSGDALRRLASVAGFGGIDMADDENADAIRPDLYPTVLQSTPFILYLIDQTVATTNGKRTTVGAVLMPDNEFGGWFRTLFSGNETADGQPTKSTSGGPVKLSARQQELAEDIAKRVSARLDTRSGVIGISARMPDADVAAAVAQLAMNYLTEYVTNYRTEKARLDLRFYAQRLNEARQRYQKAQFSVFRYNDQHKYSVVVMQAATMEKQRMDAELSIAQTVYTELSREFERARIKVQERTPVFKVLEPAQVPLKRVSPKRVIIVLFSMLTGLTLGVVYLVARQNDITGRVRAMMEEKS